MPRSGMDLIVAGHRPFKREGSIPVTSINLGKRNIFISSGQNSQPKICLLDLKLFGGQASP